MVKLCYRDQSMSAMVERRKLFQTQVPKKPEPEEERVKLCFLDQSMSATVERRKQAQVQAQAQALADAPKKLGQEHEQALQRVRASGIRKLQARPSPVFPGQGSAPLKDNNLLDHQKALHRVRFSGCNTKWCK